MMKIVLLLSLFVGASLVAADTLVLRDGSTVDGSFLGGDNRSIRFAVGDQVKTYSLNDVDSIRFGNSPAPASASTNPSPGDTTQPSAPAQTPALPASAPATGAMGVEITAGTQIVIRMIDAVNSETDTLGQTYRASTDQPIVVNGQTVIPRGADVIATLIDAKQSGKIEGRTVLTLDLKSVTVNGRSYDIVTTGVSKASSSRGARSAKVIGGTAALGAIIGGAAGGGRGAAIGAGSGAAVGTAAEVATSGQKVKIPAETRLTFTLQNPLDL
ncbi:MAG: hypothetical protein JOY62_11875 [Acidobacteriaceae bacterium]|nr:hypothetical protein [Acidobacteriaceae bacterium]MBV9780659.1 hypothetical protein [Acidobacteriaceae bacterium]